MILFHVILWSAVTFISFCRITHNGPNSAVIDHVAAGTLFTACVAGFIFPWWRHVPPSAALFCVGGVFGWYLMMTGISSFPTCERIK